MTVVITITVLLAFVGACAVSTGPDSSIGSVRFRIVDGPSALAVGPDDTEIAGYRVYGFGPSGRTVEVPFSSLEVTIGDLLAGSWSFVVDAENAGGIPVLSGQAETVVESGQTTSVDITLAPIDGVGTLIVEVRWPNGTLDSEEVTATLAAYEGTGFGTPDDLTPFDMSENGETTLYRYEGLHEAGYYMLYTEVSDSSGTPWENAGAVRIMNALETVVMIDLETGSVEITITAAPQNPLTVALSASGDLVFPEENTVTVTADVEGGTPPYTYAWFLNGALVDGETTNQIVIGDGLAAGRYRLSLIVSDGEVLGSDGVVIDITQ
ncbi:MAG: hypothetical protein EA426_10475 [Spirochaetaceae bacterium]|nr:MAG: hypothetical protein EA426_10475 [Spirochaetaceae bacterium]